ncbi:unnamed protein product [Rotaria sordida]|uniref:Uncharacterized protein n=2 Tax=Rotaria sordida TaxID=392033 RepID=A0A814C7W9_9BILA|nr:unnamed protein product [Rotaria sordida]
MIHLGNQSTKTTTTTTDNDNEIYSSAKCLKQIDDSNIQQTEETKHDLTDDEESEEAELLLVLHVSKVNTEDIPKIEDLINKVLPIEKIEKLVILKELGLNLNILDEFKMILLSNQIIHIIQNIYFKLTKKQIDTKDLKQIVNDIHIEIVRVTRTTLLRG